VHFIIIFISVLGENAKENTVDKDETCSG
jgi:hypothetical protein